MKDFETKAEESVPCVRVKNADATAYRITEAGLLPAEEIGNDDYPEYGDWLPCEAITADGDLLGQRYLETPGQLANEFVSHDATEGFEFRLTTVDKDDDDVWNIEIEELDNDG